MAPEQQASGFAGRPALNEVVGLRGKKQIVVFGDKDGRAVRRVVIRTRDTNECIPHRAWQELAREGYEWIHRGRPTYRTFLK